MNLLGRAARSGVDPIGSAIDTTLAAHQMGVADRELGLRERAATREEAESSLRQEQMRGAIDFEGERRGRDRKTWKREDEAEDLRKDLAALDAGAPLTSDQLTRVFGARSMLNLDKQEPLDAVMKAHNTAGQFFSQLPQVRAQGPVRIDRNDQNDETFQALERLSASREGAVHSYETMDIETGGTVQAPGVVSGITSILYDPTTDSVGVAMSIVDPNTGRPLFGPDGQRIVVPATEGRSSAPDDPIKMVPRNVLVENSRLGMERNTKAVQQLSQQPPVAQRKIVLAQLAARGDESARTELKGLREVEQYVSAAQAALVDPSLTLLARRELQSIVQIGNSGVATVEQIKTLSDKALGEARATRAKEIENDAALTLERKKGDLPLSKAKREEIRLETQRAESVAKIGAEGRAAAKTDEETKALLKAYRTAAPALVNAKAGAARTYAKLAGDPLTPEGRAASVAAKDPKALQRLRDDYVASDPAVIQAETNLQGLRSEMGVAEPAPVAGASVDAFFPSAPQTPPAAPAVPTSAAPAISIAGVVPPVAAARPAPRQAAPRSVPPAKKGLPTQTEIAQQAVGLIRQAEAQGVQVPQFYKAQPILTVQGLTELQAELRANGFEANLADRPAFEERMPPGPPSGAIDTGPLTLPRRLTIDEVRRRRGE